MLGRWRFWTTRRTGESSLRWTFHLSADGKFCLLEELISQFRSVVRINPFSLCISSVPGQHFLREMM